MAADAFPPQPCEVTLSTVLLGCRGPALLTAVDPRAVTAAAHAWCVVVPERAVRAGLRILEAIADLNEEDAELSLAVRVGVESGEAVVALGARPEHGEGLVAGDVVNTASRLQGAAPVGGVLVGPGTYAA